MHDNQLEHPGGQMSPEQKPQIVSKQATNEEPDSVFNANSEPKLEIQKSQEFDADRDALKKNLEKLNKRYFNKQSDETAGACSENQSPDS